MATTNATPTKNTLTDEFETTAAELKTKVYYKAKNDNF